jgi:HEPN domain-containing protein
VAQNAAITDEIVGFHIQQAIEKTIKAVLTRFGIQYEFTHDLSVLYQQVEAAGINPPASIDAVDAMTVFAVQLRYTLFEEQTLDRKIGLWLAREFIGWANALTGVPLPSAHTNQDNAGGV